MLRCSCLFCAPSPPNTLILGGHGCLTDGKKTQRMVKNSMDSNVLLLTCRLIDVQELNKWSRTQRMVKDSRVVNSLLETKQSKKNHLRGHVTFCLPFWNSLMLHACRVLVFRKHILLTLLGRILKNFCTGRNHVSFANFVVPVAKVFLLILRTRMKFGMGRHCQ